jgi:hypothetical protein
MKTINALIEDLQECARRGHGEEEIRIEHPDSGWACPIPNIGTFAKKSDVSGGKTYITIVSE